MTWPLVELGAIADIQGGGTPSRDEAVFWGGGIPWVTPTDLPSGDSIAIVTASRDTITNDGLQSSAAKILPPGTVLYSSRATIGKVGIAAVPVTTNQGFANLIPKPDVDSRFLAYSLIFHTRAIERLAGSTTFKEVAKSALRKFRIALPPLAEQRHIIERLDRADRLRTLRAEADAKGNRILPALFIKMFGDPATNPKQWPEVPVRSLVSDIRAGWSAPNEGRPRHAHELGVLKVSAVTSGKFRPAEHKAVPDVPPGITLLHPMRGDLLMSRANTRDLVAATCLVERDEPKLFLSDKLWSIVPDPDRTSTAFLKHLFSTRAVRDRLRARSTGTSGSMLNLSQEAFLSTLVPLPALPLQEEFSSIAWRLIDVAGLTGMSAEKIQSLWRVTLKRVFENPSVAFVETAVTAKPTGAAGS
jgi:type I restriction enzyme S subunit